jgi:hypothetical protein
MFTRKPRLQLEKFAINGAKRLLQHNQGNPDIEPTSPQGRVGPDSDIGPILVSKRCAQRFSGWCGYAEPLPIAPHRCRDMVRLTLPGLLN